MNVTAWLMLIETVLKTLEMLLSHVPPNVPPDQVQQARSLVGQTVAHVQKIKSDVTA